MKINFHSTICTLYVGYISKINEKHNIKIIQTPWYKLETRKLKTTMNGHYFFKAYIVDITLNREAKKVVGIIHNKRELILDVTLLEFRVIVLSICDFQRLSMLGVLGSRDLITCFQFIFFEVWRLFLLNIGFISRGSLLKMHWNPFLDLKLTIYYEGILFVMGFRIC